MFDLQDQVAATVAGVIEPILQAAEIRRATGRPTADLTAYDLYLRALQQVFSAESRGYTSALDLLRQAIDRGTRHRAHNRFRARTCRSVCAHVPHARVLP